MTDLRSFVPVSPDSHFPIQNLPYGVFRPRSGKEDAVGTAIGDMIVDLGLLEERGLLQVPGSLQPVFRQASLNAFMALGRDVLARGASS